MSYSLIILKLTCTFLFMIKVKIFVFIKWSYRPLQSYWLLNLEWWTCFELLIQSLSSTCFLSASSYIHSNLGTSSSVAWTHVIILCEVYIWACSVRKPLSFILSWSPSWIPPSFASYIQKDYSLLRYNVVFVEHTCHLWKSNGSHFYWPRLLSFMAFNMWSGWWWGLGGTYCAPIRVSFSLTVSHYLPGFGVGHPIM